MLSQPRIAQMTSKIAEEVSYVLSTEAITDAERGNAGGLAAPLLKSGLESLKMRRGESELGAATLREAAQILTFNGRHWGLVREGVLCTKLLGQHGPCTRGRGAPDPGACHGDCLHRLELARAKAQCEEALGILLNEYSLAIDDGMEMIVANLKGQILANLMRWDDVRERYLAISPTATEIWNSRASSDDQEAA
ncbi:hypothetical protein GCM10007937_54890 [Mesorhizobium albiziae]|nr:hypothetical protein GCM10007937_54890 [Mesorhizobium albiziae]